MPKTGSTLKFENYQKVQKVPYVIYADFQSVIEKLPENRQEKTEKKGKAYPSCGERICVHGCVFGWEKLVKKVPEGGRREKPVGGEVFEGNVGRRGQNR